MFKINSATYLSKNFESISKFLDCILFKTWTLRSILFNEPAKLYFCASSTCNTASILQKYTMDNMNL